MGNKDKALDFLRLATSKQVHEAFGRYVGQGFVHHNPWFASGAESLEAAMEDSARKNPAHSLEIRLAVEEGEHVAVHSRLRLGPEGPVMATVHIFRFAQGRIVEFWDLGQAEPQEIINLAGMF